MAIEDKQSVSAAGDALYGTSRLLIVLYGLFALSAGVRALYQIAARWNEAPLAYGLSAVAALIYLVACVGFNRRSPTAWRVTMAVCVFELGGVLLVGLLTILDPQLFPQATVWSGFGSGYGFIPLLLPILGLWWLTRSQTRKAYGV